MAERANFAYFDKSESFVFSTKWGGDYVWEYLILGDVHTVNAIKHQVEVYAKHEVDLDSLYSTYIGAILIDADLKRVIFDLTQCNISIMVDSVIKYDGEILNDQYEDGLNFFDLRETQLHPKFIDLLIDVAKTTWKGWTFYFASADEFLSQDLTSKNVVRDLVVRDIDQIKSVNYHLEKKIEFPFIEREKFLDAIKQCFGCQEMGEHENLACKNLEQYERSKLP